MAVPERDTIYSSDGTTRTSYTRESNATGWFVGIIVALALLAIGYLVFSANSGPSTTDLNNTPVIVNPTIDPNTAPMTEAPPAAVEPAPMSGTPVAPAETAPAPVETAPVVPADAAPATETPAAPAQ
ncbi:MAG: hypothetical protein IPK28_22070 [Devosia sp.]|nr:hypothetical protein [Devosia sp.]